MTSILHTLLTPRKRFWADSVETLDLLSMFLGLDFLRFSAWKIVGDTKGHKLEKK